MTRTGRPSTGRAVHVRIPAHLLAELDARAEAAGVSRAEAIRRVLRDGLEVRQIQALLEPPTEVQDILRGLTFDPRSGGAGPGWA